jgi:hypothetical protein
MLHGADHAMHPYPAYHAPQDMVVKAPQSASVALKGHLPINVKTPGRACWGFSSLRSPHNAADNCIGNNDDAEKQYKGTAARLNWALIDGIEPACRFKN